MAKTGKQTADLINNKSRALSNIYVKAYKRIRKELENSAGTLYRRDRAKAILSSLNKTIKTLDKETKAFIKKEVPAIYFTMAKKTKSELIIDGVKVQAFSKIHKKAIDEISKAANVKFAESMAALKKNVVQEIALAKKTRIKIRDEIAAGEILGKPRDLIARDVKKQIKKTGVTALIDRGGRNWKLDNYAKMLSSEMMATTARKAITNTGSENGLDLYEITSHGAKDACRFHEAEIFSLTGKTAGFPTLSELEASGEIFHVGCRHSYFAIEDPTKKQEITGKSTDKRLKSGDIVSNYDAKKNENKSAKAVFNKQEKRKEK